MKKTNFYYHTAFRRENLLASFLHGLAMKLYSYPRLIIETFIRRNFGRRYFNFATTLSTLVLLLVIPAVANRLSFLESYEAQPKSFWGQYATWYLFAALFGYFAFRRWQEIRYSHSTYDLTKFTLYSGDINPRFFKFDFFGYPTVRQVETIYEPLFAFLIGLVLKLGGQPIGMLLMICAVFYSLSYRAAYKQGDDFLMDMIDEVIMNKELRSGFVNDLLGHQTHGVRFYMTKPTSPEMREELVEKFVGDETENVRQTIAH